MAHEFACPAKRGIRPDIPAPSLSCVVLRLVNRASSLRSPGRLGSEATRHNRRLHQCLAFYERVASADDDITETHFRKDAAFEPLFTPVVGRQLTMLPLSGLLKHEQTTSQRLRWLDQARVAGEWYLAHVALSALIGRICQHLSFHQIAASVMEGWN
jgi:hypothetical protein